MIFWRNATLRHRSPRTRSNWSKSGRWTAKSDDFTARRRPFILLGAVVLFFFSFCTSFGTLKPCFFAHRNPIGAVPLEPEYLRNGEGDASNENDDDPPMMDDVAHIVRTARNRGD